MPPRFSKEVREYHITDVPVKRQRRTSPCEYACPAGNRIQLVETLIKEEKYSEARMALLSRNPFSGTTGRVCPAFCEEKCNRRSYDEGVAIRALERYASEKGALPSLRPLPDTQKRVAVIGAGPAGLTAAFYLRLLGHHVEVFDAEPVLGGVPRISIPDFRLPKNIPDAEVGLILSLGIVAHTNTRVGKEISIDALRGNFDVCLITTGNQIQRMLAVPGMESAVSAMEFLRTSNMKRESLAGKRVVILGGGGVAFDCAFTARRLGAASVSLVFPESADNIRTTADEIRQAHDEGIIMYPSHLTTSLSEGNVHARRLSSFTFDEKGELIAEFEDDDIHDIPGDIVICASGLKPDIDFLDGLNPKRTPRGHLAVNDDMMTSVSALFAAGDIVTGPATVTSAVGSGRKAAMGIHAFLSGSNAPVELTLDQDDDGTFFVGIHKAKVYDMTRHVVEFSEIRNPDYHEHGARTIQRVNQASLLPFEEILEGFNDAEAAAEAGRCMHCGHCIDCGNCAERCPDYIIERVRDEGPFMKYPQECWHCAACRIGCPTGSIDIEFPITHLV